MKHQDVSELYKDLDAYAGKAVTVCGWARSIRDSKTLGFIDLNDGTCFKGVQIVFEDGKIDNFREIAAQNVGAALIVTGELIATPGAKQPFEIHAVEIKVEGASTPEYPLQEKRHTVEYLRTIPHLRPRTNLFSAAFRVRSAAAFGMHKFFQENGFVYIHTPVITTTDCEGAEMFQVTTLDQDDLPKNEDGSDFTGTAEEYNAAAKAKIEDILAQVRADADPAAKFDELMRQYSQDTGLESNPDGYTFTPDSSFVDEFKDTVYALEPGEISDVVESSFGYHIILRTVPDVNEQYQEEQMLTYIEKWSTMTYSATPTYQALDAKTCYENYLAHTGLSTERPEEDGSASFGSGSETPTESPSGLPSEAPSTPETPSETPEG